MKLCLRIELLTYSILKDVPQEESISCANLTQRIAVIQVHQIDRLVE